jgi:TonB-linked SusC/RagA family outer membrane protein
MSVGWRLSEEKFWKKSVSFIENFKLRGSYGKTGNDRIDEWQYLATYQFGPQYQNQVFDINHEERSLQETVIPNRFVTWEVANQADVGFDANFLKNKMAFTFDYFDYRRSNILWNRNASVPATTGLTLPRENIGKVANKGFDFNASYDNKGDRFNYVISVNGGYQKNKILFWDEAPGAPEYQKSTGHPMNTGLYFQAIGVFKDQGEVDKTPHWAGARPGDIIFKDVNGDGNIDNNDRVRIDKNDLPTFQGGMGLNLQYKHFSLSILFQGSLGGVRYILLPEGDYGNVLKYDYDGRWTSTNTDASKPRSGDRNEYFKANSNTYFLHKTDYVKLKNAELAYRFPESLNRKIGAQNCRLYISGYNLFTFSPDLKDFDPEVMGWSSSMTYPVARIISLGLSLTF